MGKYKCGGCHKHITDNNWSYVQGYCRDCQPSERRAINPRRVSDTTISEGFVLLQIDKVKLKDHVARLQMKVIFLQVKIENTIKCECDFDKWEPESTGHTFECPRHKEILRRMRSVSDD